MCLPCLSHTMNALNIAFQSQYPHKHTVGTGLTGTWVACVIKYHRRCDEPFFLRCFIYFIPCKATRELFPLKLSKFKLEKRTFKTTKK